jgi:NADH-quinone oxidoreductase subunit L
MNDLLFLIPALPLAGFLFLAFFGKRLGEPLAGWVATLAVGSSFLVVLATYLDMLGKSGEHRALTQHLFTWLPVSGLQVEMGFLADQLSISMLLFVTGIATLIHLYAIGYMHGDPKFSKFFVYLNLFVFSMVMLVLGDNLLVTFLGWEGVGTCSYLLISFWFTDEKNASAGKKAFITNRVGDFGFMVAMFFTFNALGTLNYQRIVEMSPTLAVSTATAIIAFLFIGACGKSAQLPLYLWLPDAMAGPTPVSALIHAATMVTAGVYVLTRMNPVIAQASPWIATTIAVVGALTALFAATIAVAQNDIKKVLAYSTVSQLGYMFLAVGSGAYIAAIFHMITHAFFKALLFLGSGSVIHGMHDEQDMRRMGALRKLLPITSATFIVGWLAIAGVPPFSGFFSKDEILLMAWQKSPILWVVGLVTALLTAFYMSRQVFLVFFGKKHWDEPLEEAVPELYEERQAAGIHPGHGVGPEGPIHPHESNWLMTLPLLILAPFAFLDGWINSPFSDKGKFLEHWLHPIVHHAEAVSTATTGTKIGLAVVATAAGLLGIAIAAVVYLKNRQDLRAKIEQPILAQGWRYDSTITAFMGGPGRKAFDAIAAFDRVVIDGAVNGVGSLVRSASREGRKTQSGLVRNYALGLTIGVIVVVGLLLSKAVYS